METASADRTFLARVFGLSLVLHLAAAWLSEGFYHADEHFQILEFAAARLGLSDPAALPIEYHRAMRPWLQPAMGMGLIQTLRWLGVESPLDWALGFRFVSAVLGWGSGVALVLAFSTTRREARAMAVLSCVLWYLPALHARHSSENWAGAALLFALALLAPVARARDAGAEAESPRAQAAGAEPESPEARARLGSGIALGAGVLLGLAFELRYQAGVMVAGAWLWLLFPGRQGARVGALTAAGIALAVAGGTLLDRWGYGTWALAPWNYVDFNLIEGRASAGDSSPVWDYFRRATTESFPVLGLLALAAFCVAFLRHPRSLLTWSLAPLLLVHLAIGHKELRFLFPIAMAGPALLWMAWKAIAGPRPSRAWRIAAAALAALNAIALLATSFVPAWTPMRFYRALWEGARSGEIRELHFAGDSPYMVLGTPFNFYRARELALHPARDLAELATRVERLPAGGALWLRHDGPELPTGTLASACERRFTLLPGWLSDHPAIRRFNRIALFRCVRR